MTVRELLEIIANQVGVLTKDMAEVKTGLSKVENNMATKTELLGIKTEVAGIKTEVGSLKSIVIKIETDHSKKLGALLNGYKLNSEKLDQIEAEITKHKEIISRRIR